MAEGEPGAVDEPIIIQPVDDRTPLTNPNTAKGYGVVNMDHIDQIYYSYAPEKLQRLRFIRKVYLVLLLQLTLTASVCAICMYVDSVREYVIQNVGLMIFGIVMSFILLFILFCVRRVPIWNFICLMIWTLVEAYTIGVICGIYVEIGYKDVVLQAFVLTIILFVSLTLFTIQSKWDFSFLGVGLFASLWILIIWGIINIIFGFHFTFIYSLIGAVIFSLFIIFDTYMILKSSAYSDGDWVLAAINLYLDIINLFLMLLELLASRRN